MKTKRILAWLLALAMTVTLIPATVFADDAANEIKEAAEIMDCDVLDDVFEELSGYSIEGEDADKVDNLKKLYDRFDYEGMINLL